MLKRSEWLKQWNQRQVVVAPQLISWYSRGKRTGSCALDRNCSVTTTVDGRLVVQTSTGREVQFRCEDRASLQGWLRAVQIAARPSAPDALLAPSLAEHLPPTALFPSLQLPGSGCEALFAPSSPPPPPQLLSKEAISSIDWGTVRPAPCACMHMPSTCGRTARCALSPLSTSVPSLTPRSPRPADGVPPEAREPTKGSLERPFEFEHELELDGGKPTYGASDGRQTVGGSARARTVKCDRFFQAGHVQLLSLPYDSGRTVRRDAVAYMRARGTI